MAKRYKYVKRDTDRYGNERLYFREPNRPLVPLASPEGSEAFFEEYYGCLAELNARRKIERRRESSPNNSRTINELIARYYESSNFLKIGESTKRTYRSTLNLFAKDHGHRLVGDVTYDKLDVIIASMEHKRGAANKLIKRLRTIFRLARKIEWLAVNPALEIKFYKIGEYHTWTEDEIAKFRRCWPKGSRQRLALELHYYTGQRRSDVVKMTWDDIDDDGVAVVQLKGGAKLNIPLHPTLEQELRLHQHGRSAGTIIKTAHGKPFSIGGYGNWFRKARLKAQLPDCCAPHGLRKAATVALAHAGCTANEIMSITGHKSLSEVERYTRAANRTRLANSATRKRVSSELDSSTAEKVSHDNDNINFSKTYENNGGPGRTRTYNQAVMSRWL